MTGMRVSKLALRALATLVLLSSLLASSPALAAPNLADRRPPTRPRNLRVTDFTAYSVALAWDPSFDNSGSFTYFVHVSYGQTWAVSQTQTSFNWNFGLVPANTYSFYVDAVDGAGNRSKRSNIVTQTLLPDTTPPTAPVATLLDVNPYEVWLEWTASTDDGPYLMYQVYVNDVPNVDAWTSRSAVVHDLTPSTTYNITVRARDFYGNNLSAPSNVLVVTTSAVDPNDTEPPPPPSNLSGTDVSCGEVWLSWTQSFDNQTPQSGIRYEVYVNDVFDHTVIGTDRTILYATVNGDNTFTLIAIDAAGNRSTPAHTIVNAVIC